MKKRTEYNINAWDLSSSLHFRPRNIRNLRKVIKKCQRQNLQYAVWKHVQTKSMHKTETLTIES